MQVCTIGFVVAGVIVYESNVSRFFPRRTGGGFNLEQMMWAGIVGGVCAAIGASIGKIIERLIK